uniref:Uncharacterized protein n=1 Tax=Palpitomonas bilix TaxID=652834 RepID=A0A7S3DAJ4_9EUKA
MEVDEVVSTIALPNLACPFGSGEEEEQPTPVGTHVEAVALMQLISIISTTFLAEHSVEVKDVRCEMMAKSTNASIVAHHLHFTLMGGRGRNEAEAERGGLHEGEGEQQRRARGGSSQVRCGQVCMTCSESGGEVDEMKGRNSGGEYASVSRESMRSGWGEEEEGEEQQKRACTIEVRGREEQVDIAAYVDVHQPENVYFAQVCGDMCGAHVSAMLLLSRCMQVLNSMRSRMAVCVGEQGGRSSNGGGGESGEGQGRYLPDFTYITLESVKVKSQVECEKIGYQPTVTSLDAADLTLTYSNVENRGGRKGSGEDSQQQQGESKGKTTGSVGGVPPLTRGGGGSSRGSFTTTGGDGESVSGKRRRRTNSGSGSSVLRSASGEKREGEVMSANQLKMELQHGSKMLTIFLLPHPAQAHRVTFTQVGEGGIGGLVTPPSLSMRKAMEEAESEKRLSQSHVLYCDCVSSTGALKDNAGVIAYASRSVFSLFHPSSTSTPSCFFMQSAEWSHNLDEERGTEGVHAVQMEYWIGSTEKIAMAFSSLKLSEKEEKEWSVESENLFCCVENRKVEKKSKDEVKEKEKEKEKGKEKGKEKEEKKKNVMVVRQSVLNVNGQAFLPFLSFLFTSSSAGIGERVPHRCAFAETLLTCTYEEDSMRCAVDVNVFKADMELKFVPTLSVHSFGVYAKAGTICVPNMDSGGGGGQSNMSGRGMSEAKRGEGQSGATRMGEKEGGSQGGREGGEEGHDKGIKWKEVNKAKLGFVEVVGKKSAKMDHTVVKFGGDVLVTGVTTSSYVEWIRRVVMLISAGIVIFPAAQLQQQQLLDSASDASRLEDSASSASSLAIVPNLNRLKLSGREQSGRYPRVENKWTKAKPDVEKGWAQRATNDDRNVLAEHALLDCRVDMPRLFMKLSEYSSHPIHIELHNVKCAFSFLPLPACFVLDAKEGRVSILPSTREKGRPSVVTMKLLPALDGHYTGSTSTNAVQVMLTRSKLRNLIQGRASARKRAEMDQPQFVTNVLVRLGCVHAEFRRDDSHFLSYLYQRLQAFFLLENVGSDLLFRLRVPSFCIVSNLVAGDDSKEGGGEAAGQRGGGGGEREGEQKGGTGGIGDYFTLPPAASAFFSSFLGGDSENHTSSSVSSPRHHHKNTFFARLVGTLLHSPHPNMEVKTVPILYSALDDSALMQLDALLVHLTRMYKLGGEEEEEEEGEEEITTRFGPDAGFFGHVAESLTPVFGPTYK